MSAPLTAVEAVTELVLELRGVELELFGWAEVPEVPLETANAMLERWESIRRVIRIYNWRPE